MKIYHYDETGIFHSESEAEESPLEPGVFLIPANATPTQPPVPGAGQKAIFQAGAWAVVDIPPPPAPPVPTAAEIIEAENSAVKAELADLDMASIRAMREWIAAQPTAPQIIKDKEAAAIAARARLK